MTKHMEAAKKKPHRTACDVPGCSKAPTWVRYWPNGERVYVCEYHSTGIGGDAEAPSERILSLVSGAKIGGAK